MQIVVEKIWEEEDFETLERELGVDLESEGKNDAEQLKKLRKFVR